MTARLVNGGKAVQPHVTLRVGSPESPKYAPPVAPDMEIDPRWLDAVVRGMVAIMEGPRGKGRPTQIPVDSMEMGGKNGTSQVRRTTATQRATHVPTNHQLPARGREQAGFRGHDPHTRPD